MLIEEMYRFTVRQIIFQANGCYLRYSGRRYGPGNHPAESAQAEPRLEKLKREFSQLGALAIRFTIEMRQRAALIQQITQEGNVVGSILDAGKGGNQSLDELYTSCGAVNRARTVTTTLERISLGTLGRGKVLNECGNALKKINTEGLTGEFALWDLLHAPLRGVGAHLLPQLSKQGFFYLCHPPAMTEVEYRRTTLELKRRNFEVLDGEVLKLRTASGTVLESAPAMSRIKITVDDNLANTYQANGMVIHVEGKESAPLGWMLCGKLNTIVDPACCENLATMVVLARGGFHCLSDGQKRRLQSGIFSDNGLAAFLQNQTFNAMLFVFAQLEHDYDFDPSALLPDATLDKTYANIQHAAASGEAVDDLLTGALLTEMVQVLRVIQSGSARTALPLALSNSFEEILNNTKAFAYAFALHTADGRPVLQLDDERSHFSLDANLIDVRMHGRLRNPTLHNRKHVAAIIATALLVSEQIILELLIRDAIVLGDAAPGCRALKRMLRGDKRFRRLALEMPMNKSGPVLGLQFSYCDKLVELLRETLEHDELAEWVIQLYEHEDGQRGVELAQSPAVTRALNNLLAFGNMLQELDFTSAAPYGSRGLNAGLQTLSENYPGVFSMPVAVDVI